MAARDRRPAAQTALLIAAPLLALIYAGVIGWLWWAGPPEGAVGEPQAQAEQAEPHAEPGEHGEPQDGDGHQAAEEAAAGHEDGASGGNGHDKTPPAAEGGHAASEADAAHGDDGHGKAAGHAEESAKAGNETAEAHAPPPAPESTHEPESAPAHQPEAGHTAQAAPEPEHGAPKREPEPEPEGVEPFERTPLPPAPDPELTDRGRYGPLPVRSPDGRVAWQAYGRPFEAERGQPVIALVMTELGLAEPATLSAIQDLPGEITLAFSPYSTRLGEWVPAARAAGHEVLLQVPMEPRNTAYNDPGDKALLSTNQPEINLDRLQWVLSRAVGYVGVTNFMGSRLTVSPKDMQPILEAVGARGLLYVDARVTPASIAAKLSAQLGVPSVANDRFIDAEAARGPIDRRLSQLEELALARGVSVGFAQAYPVTIERLRKWIPEMRKRGFRLAPISATVRVGEGGSDDG